MLSDRDSCKQSEGMEPDMITVILVDTDCDYPSHSCEDLTLAPGMDYNFGSGSRFKSDHPGPSPQKAEINVEALQ